MNHPAPRIFVIGRVHGVTRRRLDESCRAAGLALAARPGPAVARVVLGEGSARRTLAGGLPLRLPEGLPRGVPLEGEMALKRRLGLAPPPPEEPRTLGAGDVQRATGLSAEALEALGLYGAVDPVEGRYGFRDLLSAREARRLVAAGHRFAAVIEAAVLLRRAGRSLGDSRLDEAGDADLSAAVAARVGGPDGQFRLDLKDSPMDEDLLFARAEGAEGDGDLATAERLYRLLARLDRGDPVIPFNLGNTLADQGRPLEAALAYREALARDRGFAEAWLNLGVIAEERGRAAEAEEAYGEALAARPDHPEVLYSAALFHTRAGRGSLARVLWQRFLALDPPPGDAAVARRMIRLCGAGADAGDEAAEPPRTPTG